MTRYKFDAEYVRLLLAGDPEVERHFTGQFGVLLRVKMRARGGRSPQQIDDAVQETFARTLEALRAGRLDDPERLGGFVNRVCENVLHEGARAAARLVPLDPGIAEPAAHRDPEAEAAAHQAMELARQVLDALPAKDREILDLVLVQEVDKDEVCRRFAVTREHLRVMLHRARERFRALGEQQQDDQRARRRSGRS